MSLPCLWTRPACASSFDTPEALLQHLCTTHVGRKREGTLTLECGWEACGHRASKRDHMTSHMMVHCPLKTNVCLICQKTFKRAFDLRKHETTHGAERHMSHSRSRTYVLADASVPDVPSSIASMSIGRRNSMSPITSRPRPSSNRDYPYPPPYRQSDDLGTTVRRPSHPSSFATEVQNELDSRAPANSYTSRTGSCPGYPYSSPAAQLHDLQYSEQRRASEQYVQLGYSDVRRGSTITASAGYSWLEGPDRRASDVCLDPLGYSSRPPTTAGRAQAGELYGGSLNYQRAQYYEAPGQGYDYPASNLTRRSSLPGPRMDPGMHNARPSAQLYGNPSSYGADGRSHAYPGGPSTEPGGDYWSSAESSRGGYLM